jgi:hypothetical protein
VVAGWQGSDLLRLRLGGLTSEEALALERPAMTYVASSSASGSPVSSARRTGGGCTAPVNAGQAITSCSSVHPGCGSVRGGQPPSGHSRGSARIADAQHCG